MNRVLPEDLAQRDLWEEGSFWFAWLATLVHAAWRAPAVLQARLSRAWAEQCWVVVLLGAAAVVLNALTTGDHLGRTLGAGYWPVAGVDLMLLVAAGTAAVAARKLQQCSCQPRTETSGLEEPEHA
jgi:hypothetical protein